MLAKVNTKMFQKIFFALNLLVISCKFFHPFNSIQKNYYQTLSQPQELTEEKIQNYIRVIPLLHQIHPNLPLFIAENQGVPHSIQVYEQIEKVILENGFSSYIEFIQVNAKVAWAWNLTQAKKSITDFEQMTFSGLEEIDKALNMPNLPEETKTELLKARVQILENWEKNKKYANVMVRLIQPLTNEKDLALIQKYHKELMNAFTGM